MKSMEEMFSNFYDYIGERGLSSKECEVLLNSNQIIIMGAGNCGTVLFERLRKVGTKVRAFIDNLGSVHGKEYCGVPIYTSEELFDHMEKHVEYTCIVTLLDILSYKQIKEQLVKDFCGRLNVYYFTQFRAYNKVFGIEKKPEFSAYLGEDVEVLFENRSHIAHVYDLLADEQSKNYYLELLNFYICTDFPDFSSRPTEELYFAYDLYKQINDEVFVDCGAYNGDTIDVFVNNQNEVYKKYIAIEADQTNYEKILEKVERQNIKRIDIMREYISDKKKTVKFLNFGTSYSKGEDGTSGEEIQTITLDELLCQYEPTFLKICIEGADVDAIKGAKNIIQQFLPVIAVQGHHKAEHLWGIVEQIEKFGQENYRFFLRNYRGIDEFIFYAIPQGRLAQGKN